MGVTAEKRTKAVKMQPKSTGSTRELHQERVVHAVPIQNQSSEASCNNCGEHKKSRRRIFSDQAWAVLLLWHEVHAQGVEQPICDDCYQDLRNVLIDRSDEIEQALQGGEKPLPLSIPTANNSKFKATRSRIAS